MFFIPLFLGIAFLVCSSLAVEEIDKSYNVVMDLQDPDPIVMENEYKQVLKKYLAHFSS